jgi:hypothetical protein
MHKWKRLIVVLLVFITSFTTLATQFGATPVYADTNSNTRIAQLIDFAQNKKFDKIEGAEELTAKDLQVLGIFISNFYSPWETRVDLLDENSQVMKDTVNALVTYAGFDESVATAVVKMCWQISNNGEPLKIAKYDVATRTVGEKVSRNTGESCSFDEMLYYMSGGSRVDNDGTDYCMYWGTNKVVMESFNDSSDGGLYMSPSALSFFWATAGIDWKYGRGSSLTAKTSMSEAESIVATSDGKDFMTDWAMNIDAFGNITCDTEKGKYIVLPACMNAYTWSVPGKGAGQALNLVSLIGLANTDFREGSGYDSEYKEKNKAIRMYAYKGSDGKIKYDFGYNSGLSNYDTYWTAYRDVAESSYDDATDFSTWHWKNILPGGQALNTDSVAQLAKAKGLKTEDDKSNTGSTWQMPSWCRLALALQNQGSINNLDIITDFIIVNDAGAFQNDENPVINVNPNGVFSDKTYWVDGANGCDKDNKQQDEETFYEPLPSVHDSIGTGDQIYNMSNGNLGKSGANNFVYGIYLSYILAYYGDSRVGYTFDKDNIPEIKATDLVFSDLKPVADDGKMLKDLQGFAYYFLNPKEGIRYIKQWFNKTATSILVSIHEGIVGSGGNSTVGVKKYVGFSGYVTTPQLKDLSWTAKLVDSYTSTFIYLLTAIIILLILYVIVGEMSIQQMGLGVLIFALCAFFPPYLIDGTIGMSNLVADSIYGQKFMYWALVETQTYAKQIEESATSGNYSDYLITLFKNNNSNWNTDEINAIDITVKWLCPKKNNYMYSAQKEASEAQGNQQSMLLSKATNPLARGETFMKTASAGYLYRSYTDVMNYSRYLYKHMKSKGINGVDDTTQQATGVPVSEIVANTDDAHTKGFNVLSGSSDATSIHWKSILTSKVLGNTLNEDVSKATQSAWYGIKQSDIDYDLSSINTASGKLDNSGLYAYAQLSESPYYYFSWNFFDQGMSPDEGATNGFKSLVLGSTTGGGDSYFYNTKSVDSSSGELRDYLDMRNLFTAVIPVLKASNDLTTQWDEMYGLNTYDGVSCNPDDTMDASLTTDQQKSEWQYKHWHNVNVARLWNSYTPWVDVMYDSSYSKPEKVRVGGKMKLVKNPIDPSSYFADEGRPMVFSYSEMKYYGLEESDLTTIESKILQVQKQTREDLLYLMNYYNFNDSVLNASASMIATFNFNQVFSEKHLLSSSHTLYPQAFELKNFSYDAYLRFIMANASGESLSSSGNIYQTIVENTSVITGALMILNDAIVCYAISGEKLIFLLAIFVLSIMMIVCATINLEVKVMEVVVQGLIKPLAMFLLISVCHTKVISFFMGEGTINVTGELNTSISLGDPSMTLLLLLVVHVTVTILYFGICRGLVKNAFKYGKAIFNSAVGVVGGIMHGVTGGMATGRAVALGGLVGTKTAGSLASSAISKFRTRSDKYADTHSRGVESSKKGSLTTDKINSRINNEALHQGEGNIIKDTTSSVGTKNVGYKSATVGRKDGDTVVQNKEKNFKLGSFLEKDSVNSTSHSKDADGRYSKPTKDKLASSTKLDFKVFGGSSSKDKRTGDNKKSAHFNLLFAKGNSEWDYKAGVKKSSISVLGMRKGYSKNIKKVKPKVGSKKGLGAKNSNKR